MGLSDKASTAASYVASAGAFGAGLTVNEAAAIGGLALATATFAVNVVFKVLHYRLKKAAQNAELKID